MGKDTDPYTDATAIEAIKTKTATTITTIRRRNRACALALYMIAVFSIVMSYLAIVTQQLNATQRAHS